MTMVSGTTVWILMMLFVFTFVAVAPADAYVDPGTASYVFQLLAGVALGAMFLVRTFWNRLVTGLRSLVSRDAAPHQ